MLARMEVCKDGWRVIFGKKGNLWLETPSYRRAFFWIKYQKQITKEFIMDYVHNR